MLYSVLNGTETATNALETIVDSTDTVISFTSKVFDLLVANPFLVVLMGTSLVGVGIGVFKRLKGAAR